METIMQPTKIYEFTMSKDKYPTIFDLTKFDSAHKLFEEIINLSSDKEITSIKGHMALLKTMTLEEIVEYLKRY